MNVIDGLFDSYCWEHGIEDARAKNECPRCVEACIAAAVAEERRACDEALCRAQLIGGRGPYRAGYRDALADAVKIIRARAEEKKP